MNKPTQTPAQTRRRFKTVLVTRPADASPVTVAEGPEAALPLLAALYSELDANKEHFMSLSLNARHRITGWTHVSTGTLNASIVHPREVFSALLRLDAMATVLVHNHPSGETSPSGDDISLTRRLHQIGQLIGIEVVDHLIIGPVPAAGLPNWTSLKMMGLL